MEKGSMIRIKGAPGVWRVDDIEDEKVTATVPGEDNTETVPIEDTEAYAFSDIGPDMIGRFYRNEESIYGYAERTGCWPRKPRRPGFMPSLDDTRKLLESFRNGHGNPYENGWFDNSLFLEDWIDYRDRNWDLVTPQSVAEWADYMIWNDEDEGLTEEEIDEIEDGLDRLEKVLGGEKAEIPVSYWEYRFPSIGGAPSIAMDEESWILDSLMEYLDGIEEPTAEELLFMGKVWSEDLYPGKDPEAAVDALRTVAESDSEPRLAGPAALALGDIAAKEGRGDSFFWYATGAALGKRLGRIKLSECYFEKDMVPPGREILKRLEEDMMHTLRYGTPVPELGIAELWLARYAESMEEQDRHYMTAGLVKDLLEPNADIDRNLERLMSFYRIGLLSRDRLSEMAEAAIRDYRTLQKAFDVNDMIEAKLLMNDWCEDDDDGEDGHPADTVWMKFDLNFMGEGPATMRAEVAPDGTLVTVTRPDREGNPLPFLFEDADAMRLLDKVSFTTTDRLEPGEYFFDATDALGKGKLGGRTVLPPLEGFTVTEIAESETDPD